MVRKDGAASTGASRNVPPDGFEGIRSTKLTDETRATGRSVIVKRVTDKAGLCACHSRGTGIWRNVLLAGIAAALNKRGIPTESGHGIWRSVRVACVLARL
jgi:hypothetical protein